MTTPSVAGALEYIHLDVFTDLPFTGNPLAVFLNAGGLDEWRMQRIANEMAFPETTFVFRPEAPGTDARVRIFTPSRELPMAGHPTIGTTFALAAAGRLHAGADKAVLGLGIGPTAVHLEWGPEGLCFAWMTQPLPTLGPTVTDTVAVAAALGVQPSDLAGGHLPVQVASSGVPFLYVPLNSRAAVDAACLERTALCALLRAVNLEELPVFVFSLEPGDDDATVYSRMFAPAIGIPEDPATGGASGPLGAYLLQHNAASANTATPLVNLQGVRMGRPGRIYIALSSSGGVLQEVRIGGKALVIGHGTLQPLQEACASDTPRATGRHQC
jgi:trans-2,3-dihydro-3-hydroxyanthranilate isomerase